MVRLCLAIAFASPLACGGAKGPSEVLSSPMPSPSAVPVPAVSPSPSGSIVYFVADPERINRGDSSDLRWECIGDVPYVDIIVVTVPEQLLGPFTSSGSIRVRPKQTTLYSLRAHSTSSFQIPLKNARVFVNE
jgi:hypothetical protein